MNHMHFLSRLATGAAIVAAPLLAACLNDGHHHALGDEAALRVPTLEAQGCCSSNTASSAGQHGDHGNAKPESQTGATQFKSDPYLLDTDPVSGAKLGPIESQVIVAHEGRELRFASQQSADKFKTDPAKVLADVDKKLVAQQKPFYALQTCPVSGEKLGGMGEPVDFVFNNRLVRLCCAGCRGDFQKDPAKYVAKQDAAVVAAQSKKFAPKTCAVSGQEFGGEMGEPVDYVIGNRLVRLCCTGCIKKLRNDPLKYFALLDKPVKAEEKSRGGGHDHGDNEELAPRRETAARAVAKEAIP